MPRSKMLSAGIIMCFFGISGLAIMLYARHLDARLEKEGIRATAKVLDLYNQGNRVDGHEYFAELEVTLPDGTMQHLTSVRVANDLADSGGVGSTWNVIVLPDRPRNVYPPKEIQSPKEQALVRWVLTLAASGMLAGGLFFLVRWFRSAPGS